MQRGKSFSSISAEYVISIIILVLLQYSTICAVKNEQARCPASSCGKITNISHPFRLKDDPAKCGDPRYELSCENNVTVLYLFPGSKYYVQEINYRNFTIRLVDPGIQDANCSSIPRYFLSAINFTDSYAHDYYPNSFDYPYQATYGYYSDLLFDIVIYLQCSNPVRDDPRYVDTASCVNWGPGGHSYVMAGDMLPVEFKSGCQVKLVAATSFPFSKDAFDNYWVSDRYKGIQKFSYGEIHRMLVYGFNISWMSRPCEDHCGKLDHCYFNETSASVGCQRNYCLSPLGRTLYNCEKYSKLRIFVEDVIQGIYRGLMQAVRLEPSKIGTIGVSDYKLGVEIGIVPGRYVLPTITIRFVLGSIIFIALLVYKFRKRHTSVYENIEDFLQGNTLMPIRYSYKEIKNMTKNFKDKLGEGGFGIVYKGKLRSGPLVAIKMLGQKSNANGQEFIGEVATIGRIHHANVVRLIGFCVEGSKRALVYEFMPNSSLDKYIFSKEEDNIVSLTCEKIYEISLGIARGIAYLHEGCDMQILHFDIKPHNILLDENFVAKVSDFGLAKLYPVDNSIVTLTVRGTTGYMAPELFYQNIGGVSHKADVYSFGMLLMEMACKRRNLNSLADHSSQLFFPFSIYDQLTEEREIEMEEITNEEMDNNAKKMFIVALWCIQLKPNDRPSMKEVIKMLEGDVESIEMPPKPSLYANGMI